MVREGGVLVVPAAPALVRLQRDPIYRQAMISADAAIPDSGLMVLVSSIVGVANLRRISGLAYLQRLITEPSFRTAGGSFFVLPNANAKTRLLGWAATEDRAIAPEDCYVAPLYPLAVEDASLVEVVRS